MDDATGRTSGRAGERSLLTGLFARRWAVPLLAELESGGGGGRLVALANRTGAGRATARQSIDLLLELGLVQENSGHGHPLRPEFVLTGRGRVAAPPSAALVRALERIDAMDLGLRKWSMPALAAVGSGAHRFGEITDALGFVTDRAASIALGDLESIGLVRRVIEDGRPPRPVYNVSARSSACLRALRAMVQ